MCHQTPRDLTRHKYHTLNLLFHPNSARDSEIQLLEEAKRCRAELKRLQMEVESAEQKSTSEEPGSEVNDLRQQLLQAYNELKAAEERDYRAQHELKWSVYL